MVLVVVVVVVVLEQLLANTYLWAHTLIHTTLITAYSVDEARVALADNFRFAGN